MISKYRYHIVQDIGELHQLIRYCKQTGYCSSDFESTGTSAMYPGSKPTILGVSFQPGSAWIIPLAHKESIFQDNWVRVLQLFGREIIENPIIVKIGQNIKYEMNWWRKYGIIMRGRVFDTMLAKYILDEERPHDLKSMVERFIPEHAGYDLPGQPSDKATPEQMIMFWSNVPLETLSKYCALDADLTFRLWIFFEQRLIDNGFYPLFRNMMMMASRVLSEAEYEGMEVDMGYVKSLIDIYQQRISDCDKALRNNPLILKYEKERLRVVKQDILSEYAVTGNRKKASVLLAGGYNTKKEKELLASINFGSPKQMIELLFDNEYGFRFDIVKFTTDKKTKKPTKTPSTDEDTLTELLIQDDTGFIKSLLEYRELTKLYSTYIDGIWKRTHSDNRVHGSFLLHGTVTGRLSSRNPNLQNIPRDTTSSDIKKMFIAPKGWLILQLDYSQAELRVLATSAKEETMIKWFKDGKDIHTASCALKWGVEYDFILGILKDDNNPDFKLWKARRKQAKTINFGIVYGQTAIKLAENLAKEGEKVTINEAQEFLDDFNRQFPKIRRFIDRQKKFAAQNGYVYNLFGRKRRLLNINSDNWGKKSEAERQSVNAPIQGAASDFALFSSILIRESKKKGIIPSELIQVGTVHDSLIFYFNPLIIHSAIPVLYEICRNPETKTWFNFEIQDIEMKVDFEIGKNWGELHAYDKTVDYSTWVA
jgi:DNA polymerase I-like protein with 3'-5' exonuclease and polymerase domains